MKLNRAAARLGVLLLLAIVAWAQPVPIGYFGPAAGTVWEGAQLAVEEANEAGDSVRIVQGWDDNPWSGGSAVVVRMAYQERVVAIIGSITGDATHLAEQIVAKALLVLVDPASTDRTVNAAFVPWMFSVMPDDRALMRALVAELPPGPFILLTSVSHDPRMMTKEFLAGVGPRRPVRHVEFDRPDGIATQLAGIEAATAVILANASDSARLVRDLRTARPDLALFGSHTFGLRAFRELAGEAAVGARFPSPGPVADEFVERFRRRYGQAPDYAAAHAFDATSLIIAAIREAGPDRAAIRDALLGATPYEGASGRIVWDELRRNSRPVTMATILPDGR